MNSNERDGLQEIIDKALDERAREAGDSFDIDRISLTEFCRRTKLTRSRARARTLKAKGFKIGPNGRCGMKVSVTVLIGYASVIDDMLRHGIISSEVIFGRTERISKTKENHHIFWRICNFRLAGNSDYLLTLEWLIMSDIDNTVHYDCRDNDTGSFCRKSTLYLQPRKGAVLNASNQTLAAPRSSANLSANLRNPNYP